MEKKIVKLGLLGCGGRGPGVVSEILGDDNVQLCAICDINPDRVEKVKQRFEKEGAENIQCFTDMDAFLKSDIDTVYVATDASLHTDHSIAALEAGKHVLSEVPAIDSLEQARKLKAAVVAHPKQKYMFGENACFYAYILTAKKMYEDGRLGQLVYADAEYLHGGDITDLEHGDNIMNVGWRRNYDSIKYLTHDLGRLLFITGDKVTKVTCFEPTVRYYPDKTGSENGVALFTTESGAVYRILICFGAFVGFDHNLTLYGTRGMLETDRVKANHDYSLYGKFADIPGTFNDKLHIPVGAAYRGEQGGGHGGCDRKMMRAFIKCILEDTKPPIDVDMGIQMSIPGILAHESAVNGGIPIDIPQF